MLTVIRLALLPITARQYGEVVLPDDSTGQSPGTPRQRGHKTVTVQGGYGVVFAVMVQNFIACWCDRGTSLIGAANLSQVTNLVEGTGAVSRYNVDRSQKTVKVYGIYIACRCACPGERTITNLSWVQEQKQKP